MIKILNYIFFGLSVRNWFVILSGIIVLSTLLIFCVKTKKIEIKAVLFLLYMILICAFYYAIPSLKFVGLYLILPTSIITLIFLLMKYQKPLDPIWDIKFLTNKGDQILRGLARGVAIFGAAGSGKTASIIYTIMKHFAKANFSGIIYDFKNGELTELAVPLYGDRLKVIAVHDPKISIRVNPISPEYLNGEKEVNEIVAVIMDNLIGSKDDFFKDSASSLLSAVILKFWFDHQEYCTIPHVISFILSLGFGSDEEDENNDDNKFLKFKEFLTSNERVAIQASPFLLGLDSEKQTAAVLATLSNALRKISFPEAFWVLSKNEMDFNINDPKNNFIVSVLNEPKSSRFLSPINATIIHSISKQMMVRGRAQSFIMLDEAPTIKLLNMAQIPATMRSFKVATIYCAQDIVQGYVQYGREGFKEIVSNLSTQFFGKSNDPDTSKFYEGYFELTKEATKSITQKGDGNIFGSKSTTTGEREVGRVRSYEFNQLKVGEFAMLSDGKNEIVRFEAPKLITGKIPQSEKLHPQMIEENFTQIITEAKSLISQNLPEEENFEEKEN